MKEEAAGWWGLQDHRALTQDSCSGGYMHQCMQKASLKGTEEGPECQLQGLTLRAGFLAMHQPLRDNPEVLITPTPPRSCPLLRAAWGGAFLQRD